MARKARPCAAQQTSLAHGRLAMQNDALAKPNGNWVAMHPDAIARFNLYPPVQFDMRMKMRVALFDFNATWRVKGFGG